MSKQNYEDCKKEIINKYMKKYEKGKLFNINQQPITNRKQAIAIALSIADKQCNSKISKKDIINKEKKVKKAIYLNNKIKDGKLSYTSVKDAIIIINKLKKDKRYTKSNKLKNDLIIRVFRSIKSGDSNRLILDDMIKLLS